MFRLLCEKDEKGLEKALKDHLYYSMKRMRHAIEVEYKDYSNNLKGNPVEGFAEKSREAAVEGIVLLKNEGNVLPLTEDDKISVFWKTND